MKLLTLVPVPLLLTSVGAVYAATPVSCPTNAVFLAVTDPSTGTSQVRGYSTRANGPTAPCQILQGSNTTLATANSISISVHGNLHVLQFLTNGTIVVFGSGGSGNIAPQRIESMEINNLVAVATDSNVNDFALSNRDGVASISVTPGTATTAQHAFVAPGFQMGPGALTVDIDDNLVVGGYDPSANALIETMGTSTGLGAPAVVRQIAGANTGLFPGNFEDFSRNTISLATDAESGEIYVYNYSSTSHQAQVSVFAAGVGGNVAPSRVIAGPLTQIGAPGGLNNKIAVAADGRLFVAEAGDRILVFAPGAAGNIAPAQIIQDPTGLAAPQGGIGVRSCTCH